MAGGGASVIYSDTICDLGGSSELANYGEYSGAPSESQTFEYAKTVLSLMTKRKHPDGERGKGRGRRGRGRGRRRGRRRRGRRRRGRRRRGRGTLLSLIQMVSEGRAEGRGGGGGGRKEGGGGGGGGGGEEGGLCSL